MGKELEDLNCGEEVKTKYGVCYAYSPDVIEEVKKSLHRLEAIDNSNPSEALECLEEIKSQSPVCHYDDGSKSYVFEKEFTTIKQALLKAQKEHKALEIIKEKPFESADCINYLTINKNNSNMLDYKHYCMTIKDTLAEEEFELLRSVLE